MDITLRADTGQWQFHERQILLSTKRAWNKERVAWSQKWLLYYLPEGYSGVTGVRRQRRTRAIERWGIPQDVDAERERTLISRMPLNSNIQLSLSLAQHFLFETLLLVLERIFIYDQISQISFYLYNARSFRYFFFSSRIYLEYLQFEIWHVYYQISESWKYYRKHNLVCKSKKIVFSFTAFLQSLHRPSTFCVYSPNHRLCTYSTSYRLN
jgi:hypothetical protein